ncbi:MAG: hypothetical protein AAF989_14810, partial [Planctomycetota bacterium]
MLLTTPSIRVVVFSWAIALMVGTSLAEQPDDLVDGDQGLVKSRLAAERAPPTLAELKATGLKRSRFESRAGIGETSSATTAADDRHRSDLSKYPTAIRPLLERYCVDCHGPSESEGNLRI